MEFVSQYKQWYSINISVWNCKLNTVHLYAKCACICMYTHDQVKWSKRAVCIVHVYVNVTCTCFSYSPYSIRIKMNVFVCYVNFKSYFSWKNKERKNVISKYFMDKIVEKYTFISTNRFFRIFIPIISTNNTKKYRKNRK